MITALFVAITPAFMLWILSKTPFANSRLVKGSLLGGCGIYVITMLLFAAIVGISIWGGIGSVTAAPPHPYDDSDCFLRYPYETLVSETQGPHGAEYGHWAIDLAGGAGSTILSPIDGEIIVNTMDGYGNPTLEIKNNCHLITLLHGNWNDFAIGEKVYAGQPVGTESNQGYTFGYAGRYCGTDSGCGYHLHINVEDEDGKSIDPRGLWSMSDRPASTADYSSYERGNTHLKISIYDPNLGGVNCADPCGMMASGELVADWWGRAAACPADIPFWTVIHIEEVGDFTCLDRGGAIVRGADFMWVDLLLHQHDFETVPVFGTLLPPQMWAIEYKE